MPGAGKSTAAYALESLGFSRINMGDVVRNEANRRSLDQTDDNMGVLMFELRKSIGAQVIAQLCLKSIEDSLNDLILVDGIRSMNEVEVFRTKGEVFLLAIHASPSKRYGYLSSRRRNDAPPSWNDFCARDKRELAIGLGSPIALADEVIANNYLSIEELQQETVSIVKRVMSKNES